MDKMSVTATECLQAAVTIAADAQAPAVESEHLLKALLDSHENNITAIIERVGADPAQLKASTGQSPKRSSAPPRSPTAGPAWARWAAACPPWQTTP